MSDTVILMSTPIGEEGEWVEKAMQIALQTLATQRGGELTIKRADIDAANESMERWFPQGAHVHFEWTDQHVRVSVQNALTCGLHGDNPVHKEPKPS